MSDIDNVVQLKPRDPNAPTMAVKRARFCRHRYLLNENRRSVECSECGRQFDAFDAFSLAASEWQRHADNLRHLQDQVLKASEELKELKRQVQNAKAQLRTANARTSATRIDASTPDNRGTMTPDTSEPGDVGASRARGQREKRSR